MTSTLPTGSPTPLTRRQAIAHEALRQLHRDADRLRWRLQQHYADLRARALVLDLALVRGQVDALHAAAAKLAKGAR